MFCILMWVCTYVKIYQACTWGFMHYYVYNASICVYNASILKTHTLYEVGKKKNLILQVSSWIQFHHS